jgi:predicted nucleic acid-binding protein
LSCHCVTQQELRNETCLWLASQAIQHGFKLLTRNPGDFDDIPGLIVVTV